MADSARFAGRTVAVTGAGGFIGEAVARTLSEAGADVVGLEVSDSAAARVEATGARFVGADVTDALAVAEALRGTDLVVHTAAYVHDWGEMAEFVRVNVGGTARVLDAAEEAGATRIVHLSSVVVYGYDDPSEQDETASLRATGIPYIDTKSASDRLARRRGAVVIRPGDVYGPGSVPWVLRPIEMARSGRMAVPGRGEGIFLPVYIDDLVEAILRALEDGRPGRVYTAWEGVPVSIGEYFDRLAALVGKRPASRLPRPVLELAGAAMEAAARLRGADPPFTARAVTFVDRRGTASIERIRDELGWEPQVTLDEGLRRTEEWLRGEGLI